MITNKHGIALKCIELLFRNARFLFKQAGVMKTARLSIKLCFVIKRPAVQLTIHWKAYVLYQDVAFSNNIIERLRTYVRTSFVWNLRLGGTGLLRLGEPAARSRKNPGRRSQTTHL